MDPAEAPEDGAASGPDGGSPAAEHPGRAPLDANGMERARFLLDFPEDPELERLIAAFERGDYAFVRRDAGKVAASTESPEVRDAALELRRRIDPDPLAKYLLGVSVALLIFLSLWAYTTQPH